MPPGEFPLLSVGEFGLLATQFHPGAGIGEGPGEVVEFGPDQGVALVLGVHVLPVGEQRA